MTTFQFDECFDDRRVGDQCNSENLCAVLRYPKRLKGKKDYEVLPEILKQLTPLVTKDFRILDDNKESIPDVHPGVIVLRTQKPSVSFTSSLAARNLAKFKSRFAAWHTTDWRNLFVEIDEESVCIFNKVGDYSPALFAKFSDEQFAEKVEQAVNKLSKKQITGS